MIICTCPGCQTTAGCRCGALGFHQPSRPVPVPENPPSGRRPEWGERLVTALQAFVWVVETYSDGALINVSIFSSEEKAEAYTDTLDEEVAVSYMTEIDNPGYGKGRHH